MYRPSSSPIPQQSPIQPEADQRRAHTIDDFSAMTLTSDCPSDSLIITAAAEGVTNREWLHNRALARFGIPAHDDGKFSQDSSRPRNRGRLFEKPLGDGGIWDW